jgi:hypothetical protein
MMMTSLDEIPNKRRDVFVGTAAALFEGGWQHAVARVLGAFHPDGARDTIDARLVRRWATGDRPIPRWVFLALVEVVERRTSAIEMQARALGTFLIRLRKEADAGVLVGVEREEAPVRNLVEDFVQGVLIAEPLRLSNRRLAIRNQITEYENILRGNGVGAEAIRSFCQAARGRVFQEITHHSPNGIPTSSAELYQDAFDELSTRSRLAIQELKDGTFQVNVSIPNGLPHVAKGDLRSIESAQEWIDSDRGNAAIKAIIAKYEK